MRYNFGTLVVILVMATPYCSVAEESPFHLEKEFQVMDKVEENLFSSMTQELQKDAVSPTKTTIDFKGAILRRSPDTNKSTTHDVNTSTKPIIKSKKVKIQREKIKRIQRRNHDKTIEMALKAQRKRALLRLQKKKYLKLWTQEDVVDIDLEKERRLYQKKLDREYSKAVLEVGKIQ